MKCDKCGGDKLFMTNKGWVCSKCRTAKKKDAVDRLLEKMAKQGDSNEAL